MYQNKFPHDSTKYYGGPITPYSDKFPHDSTKYYGGPITAFSDKFNVTWRDVTWRDVTWRDTFYTQSRGWIIMKLLDYMG